MAQHKNSFNVDIDADLSLEFSGQCDNRGYTKYRALEGALRAWISLPAEIQVRLMGGSEGAYSILLNGLLDADIDKHLDELGPAKEKLLLLLRQAKATISSKK